MTKEVLRAIRPRCPLPASFIWKSKIGLEKYKEELNKMKKVGENRILKTTISKTIFINIKYIHYISEK